MKNIDKLTSKLLADNILLSIENDELVVEYCNDDNIPDETIKLIKDNKGDLIKYLRKKADYETIENIYPLSPMQEGMLFHSLYSPNSEVYVIQKSFDFVSNIDISAFRNAWQYVIAKHTILRTSFVTDKGQKPLQRVHKAVECVIDELDYSSIAESTRKEKIITLLEEDRKKGFDLLKAPLSRFSLIKISEKRYTMIWTHHHILTDGWCLPIIFKEFYENYQAICNGEEIKIENIDKYEDFIYYLEEQDKGKAEEFWRDYLKGFENPIPIPFGYNNQKADETDTYKKNDTTLSIEDTKLLSDFSKEHHLTVNTLVQSAWSLLLSRYSGENDIVFGMTVSGRPANLPGVEEKVGLFINTLPLRVKVDVNQNVIEWLKDLQEQQPLLRDHEYIPLVNIQSLSEVSNRENLFNSIFVFENYPIGELDNTKNSLLKIENVQSFEKTNYPLMISAFVGSNLTIDISYNNTVYCTKIIEQILGHFREVLLNTVKQAKKSVAELEILTSTEKHQLLVEWNDTKADYPKDKCTHQLFEEQARKTPDNFAVVFESEKLTYRLLNERANKLGHYLQGKGVKAETLVGICVDRSLDMIVGLLGIMKAGGAYVPIDPTYPKDRINYMVEDSQCPIIITYNSLKTILPKENINELICLDKPEVSIEINKQIVSNVVSEVQSTSLVYVIYTSGSTGKPNGVMIKHENLLNFLLSMSRYPGIGEKDKLLSLTSISFDIHALELYLPLITGAYLTIASSTVLHSAELLARVIKEESITMAQATPATWKILLRNGWQPTKPLKILCGGEAIDDQLKQELLAYPSITLYNMYGPTETTVWSSTTELINGKEIFIGHPIANTQLYIVDKYYKPVPIGMPGELCIAGDGLAKGYLKRPELTAEKFIKNPFSDDSNSRLYKTGDLVRYLPDGNIEFLGRIDDQVKIRGFRIEIGEIESVLNMARTIKDCAVIAKKDSNGNKRLVAYVVSGVEFNVQEIREDLSKSLPDYMVPSLFVSLEKMPLTPNGKIDRKALPEPEGNIETTNEYVAPQNETEQKLTDIWSKVLGIEKVGIYDNFFELGGHSLLATQLISKIRNEFNIELPLKTLFEKPDLVNLSEIIKNTESESEIIKIAEASRDTDLPLSFAQERLWFIDQYDHNDSYNMPGAVKLIGKLDTKVLEKTFSEIIRRHEVLRTNIVTNNNVASQLIHKEPKFELKTVDQSHLSEEAANQKNLELIEIESQKPFDLANDSLIRLILYKINDEEHTLFLNKHHIISDGWSFSVFLKEISILYKAFSENKPSPLPDLEIQYADYAVWQRKHIEGEVLIKQSEYWKNKLSDTAILELPTDKTRPIEQTFNGANLHFSLDKDISGKLNAFSKENDVTLFMTLLSIFKVLLNKYTGQDDICVGSPIANRTRSEIEPLIGFFVNTLALRSDLSGDISFVDLVKQVKQTTLDAYANQDIPFEKVVDIVQAERNLSYSSLFQVMMVLQNNPANELSFGELSLKPVEFESTVSKFDLTLNFNETAEGFVGGIEYNTDLFDKDRIERMIGHFNVLVESIISNPTVTISELEILSSAEKYELQVEWNDTEVDYPKDKCIHELFEEQVRKTPENIAVVFENKQLTYIELNEKSNQLGHYLRGKGVKAETLVGICVDRSLDMIVGLLGIMKAGGAYVPIDPTYPEERISYMLKDAECEIVLTQEYLELPKINSEIIYLDTDWDNIENESIKNVNSEVKYNNLAYVIYTSGSTGMPKGTLIEHKNVVRLVSNRDFSFLRSQNVVLQYAPISFDASIFEIWGTICNGSKLVISPTGQLSIEELGQIIIESQIKVLWLTSGLFSLVVKNSINILDGVKYLLAGGDVLNISHVAKILEVNENITVVNGYGPTESTTFASLYFTNRQNCANASIPIGQPLDNTKLYILDKIQKSVPLGVTGELCISGDGLARGYLKQPELTAEKFIKNPFSDDPNSRLYRTGDLVRYLPDGNIEFIGRIDNQVKIRGFRIELGEIEAALNKIEAIKDCVVLAKEDSNGNKRLVAYIVSSDKLNVQEIRDGMSKSLPNYMVPSLFVSLEKMPLTPNGKIDRKALPEPEGNIETTNDYVAPRNETEQKLAAIWTWVLGVERVGIYDNFFELGGDSIITIQIVSRANQENISLTPKDIFKYQTIEELAKVSNTNERKIIAEQGKVTGEITLTPIQSWFFEEGFENKNHWNQAVMLKVKDSVEISVVENAINILVQQHDVLNLAYTIENEKWIQKHNELLKYELEVVDYSNLSGEELSKSIEEYSSKIQGSLSIEKGALFKAVLFKTNEYNELLLAINHLVVDGVSWRIIIEDLQKACLQQISNKEIDLGLKTSSFKQWSEKLSGYANSDKLTKELKFWENIIGNSKNSLPFDYSGENTGISEKSITVKLNRKLTQQLLKEAGKAYKTEINDLLLTSLAISLEKWTKNNNIIINLEGHGREDIFMDTDISRTIGWFTTQFPVNLTLEKENGIADIIKLIKEQLRGIPNKGIGYGILRYLHPDASVRKRLSPKRNNEISFNYLGQFDNLNETSDLISMSKQSSGVSVSNANHRANIIDINSLISNGELIINCSYSGSLHKKETIEDLLNSYVFYLQHVIEHCIHPESKGYTPSDFPLCEISQKDLDEVTMENDDKKLTDYIEEIEI